MDSGYYAACTALMARTQALDTIANNLANTSTTGYRAQHGVFRSLLAQLSDRPLSPLNQAINNYGIVEGARLDLTQGNLEHTGEEHDLAIEGPGFFVVQTTAGRVFTRNGSFRVSRENQLVTAAGDPVMGQNGVISLVDGPVSVSPDGTISVKGAVAGKLNLVEFAPGTELRSLGESYYAAPAGSGAPARNSSIRQGTLESSNVNAIAGMVDLITVQRSAEMMQRMLTMFNSDLNKVATQDLPRVNI